MSAELRRKVARIKSSAPIGHITPVSRRLAKDEAGRLFVYKTFEQYEAARKHAHFERDKRYFSFIHMRNIQEITRNLSNKYCGYILLLQPHIAFQTNVLVTDGRENTPLTLDDLARIWDVSKRTARAIVDELEARSIIFEAGGIFSVNERYHFRKSAAAGEVDALIKTYFSALKKFKLSAADLGFVYKLLPNVHYDTNLVCADPFAAPEDIRFLTDGEIGELVGLSATKTKEALKRLREANIIGEWVEAYDRRKKFTALNPFVFYRRQGEPDGMLRALFANKRIGCEK